MWVLAILKNEKNFFRRITLINNVCNLLSGIISMKHTNDTIIVKVLTIDDRIHQKNPRQKMIRSQNDPF